MGILYLKRLRFSIGILVFVCLLPAIVSAQNNEDISVEGLGFSFQGKPFQYTGISFFNALYNPAFNHSQQERKVWLQKFKKYGINVIRVWGQWNNTRGFVDTCDSCSLYLSNGSLRPLYLNRLKDMVQDADEIGMVVLFVFFQRESWNENIRLSDEVSDHAVRTITRELLPYRNVIFQIWNEFDHRTIDYLKIIKAIDEDRLVTNSPGYGGDLGTAEENTSLDFLSPHTSRQDDLHWEIAPAEIAYLIRKYNKPVVDDEPARKGTADFGGPRGKTTPYDHILHIYNVWKVGGHAVYHHDMFQTGYGTEAIPPSGIPDPEFDAYHHEVFQFLANKERFLRNLE